MQLHFLPLWTSWLVVVALVAATAIDTQREIPVFDNIGAVHIGKRDVITTAYEHLVYMANTFLRGDSIVLAKNSSSVYTTSANGQQTVVSTVSISSYTSVLASDTTVFSFSTDMLTQTVSATGSIATGNPSVGIKKFTVPNPATGKGLFLPGFDINTDYTKNMPDGLLKFFTLTIDDTHVLSPDGISRTVQVFNGQLPGPDIRVNWGDTVEVLVINNSKFNGTGIHWHGITQAGSLEMDGVPGVTQCPIPPGRSYTYKFRADRYGTSWYHSHYAVQYGNGAQGALIVDGPASADYDVDLGAFTLGDWYHTDAFVKMREFFATGPPAVDSIIIRGKGVYIDPTTQKQTGSYQELTSALSRFVPGLKYRIRLINTSIDTKYVFSLDGHNMTVISTDFVPIVPYQVDHQFIGIGQRYDIIITAQPSFSGKSAWFRVDPQLVCGDNVISNSTAKAIVRYIGAPAVDPNTTALVYPGLCEDPPLSLLNPVVKQTVGQAHQQVSIVATLIRNASNDLVFDLQGKGLANGHTSSLFLDYNQPTLHIINDGFKTFPDSYNVEFVDGAATDWVYFNVSNQNAIAHPFHLHGHDFSILAQGQGAWDGTVLTDNPPRRDTAMVPAQGHLVLGFQTDNPGTWLFHCHIAWHASAGLGMQFVENLSGINALQNVTQTYQNCDAWNMYTKYGEDSGV